MSIAQAGTCHRARIRKTAHSPIARAEERAILPDEVRVKAHEEFERNQSDDIPLETMAGPGGQQVRHGTSRFSDDFQLLADGPGAGSQVKLVRKLDPEAFELGMIPQHVRAVSKLHAASQPLLDKERFSYLA